MLWIKFAFVYLDFVDEAAIMEQYGNEVGLAALEWCDVFDTEYRHSTWIADEEWFTDVTSLVVDKWTSPGLSLRDDEMSRVLSLS